MLASPELLSPIFFAWRDELTGNASLSSSLKPQASSLRAGVARAGRPSDGISGRDGKERR
jgi:hypothetical protein